MVHSCSIPSMQEKSHHTTVSKKNTGNNFLSCHSGIFHWSTSSLQTMYSYPWERWSPQAVTVSVGTKGITLWWCYAHFVISLSSFSLHTYRKCISQPCRSYYIWELGQTPAIINSNNHRKENIGKYQFLSFAVGVYLVVGKCMQIQLCPPVIHWFSKCSSCKHCFLPVQLALIAPKGHFKKQKSYTLSYKHVILTSHFLICKLILRAGNNSN